MKMMILLNSATIILTVPFMISCSPMPLHDDHSDINDTWQHGIQTSNTSNVFEGTSQSQGDENGRLLTEKNDVNTDHNGLENTSMGNKESETVPEEYDPENPIETRNYKCCFKMECPLCICKHGWQNVTVRRNSDSTDEDENLITCARCLLDNYQLKQDQNGIAYCAEIYY